MTPRSLSGVRVLVGRALHQASALSSDLRKRGAQVIEIPFIEIRKPKSFKPLDAALKNLESYDWLVLTSVNGVEAMWERLTKLKLAPLDKENSRRSHHHEPRGEHERGSRHHETRREHEREGHDFSRAARTAGIAALAAEANGRRPRIAAIGPATKKALEERGLKVDVVPKEYVAESVVRSLRRRVKDKRVLLVRAKVARDVIPRELRNAGAQVDVVEAYETVVPQTSRKKLHAALNSARRRPDIVTFTSSSTVRNFVALLGDAAGRGIARGRGRPRHAFLKEILLASIGPVTSSTLREMGFNVDIETKEYTIPGLVDAIARKMAAR